MLLDLLPGCRAALRACRSARRSFGPRNSALQGTAQSFGPPWLPCNASNPSRVSDNYILLYFDHAPCCQRVGQCSELASARLLPNRYNRKRACSLRASTGTSTPTGSPRRSKPAPARARPSWTSPNPTPRAPDSRIRREIVRAFADPRMLLYEPSPAGAPAKRARRWRTYYAARGRRVARRAHPAHRQHQRSLRLPVQAAGRSGRPRAGPAAFLSAVRIPGAAWNRWRRAPYPLVYHGGWSHRPGGARRRRSTARTRAIVLVNPNNPTGLLREARGTGRAWSAWRPRAGSR